MKNLQEISIQYVKGVGPAKKKLFFNLGVENVEDLLYLFPRRYEDRRNMIPIAQTVVGEWQTISAVITKVSARKSYYTKKHVTEAVLDDGGGRIYGVWFNQPYLDKYLREGKKIVCYGKVDLYKKRLQMVSPEYEVIDSADDEQNSMNRIVPIYPLTKGMSQRYIRKVILACLEKFKGDLNDALPQNIRQKHHLGNIRESIEQIHFPQSFEQQESALRRVSFEEFYFFQLSVILRRLSITQKKGIVHTVKDSSALKFISSFPFELTGAQKKVIREIKSDMYGPHPMLRLVQGDVGCGKTVVAFFGCFNAYQNGYQSAIMAPTEILARQHYQNVCQMIDQGPLKGMKAALLVSSLKKQQKDELLQQIQNGDIDIVIGTHALISDEVEFKNLSFIVIDEQHKFGVRQRALLSEKGGNPDILIMTATPIPRTLCITLYGDLDISIIDELPPGRKKVETLHYIHDQSAEVYKFVEEKVKEGRQAYVVYPIIEESENLDLKAAEDMYRQFSKKEFKNFNIALVHGQLKQQEAEEIMQKFKQGDIDILVATTILEVGVDVPNASIMVVEHAERFGLAQLHQLRGRIGRGGDAGYCLLVSDPQTEEGAQRLKAILSTTDGFKIAQHDLEIRGPGRFFGRHQHGFSELRVANPATQLDVLKLARREAIEVTGDDPRLEKLQNKGIKAIIKKRYPTYLAMVEAG